MVPKATNVPSSLFYHTQSFGFFNTSSSLSSLDPGLGACMYSHREVSGKDIKMLSIRAPGVYRPNLVPLSYTRLNSTYLHGFKKKRKLKNTPLSLLTHKIPPPQLTTIDPNLHSSPTHPTPSHCSLIFSDSEELNLHVLFFSVSETYL